jgi:hypothetical protein
MPLLNNGDAFPKLTVPAVGGGAVALPTRSPDRGAWW